MTVPSPTETSLDAMPPVAMGSTSRDKFHNGGFEVYQPTENGHRSGLDALLLGASLPKNAAGVLADLGGGAGVAGFAALNLFPDLELVSVELNPRMHEMARNASTLPINAHLNRRMRFLKADVSKTGAERLQQGLNDASFDHVIMNPPYNSGNHRAPKDKMKSEAHIMGEGGLDAWFRTASAIVKPGGTLCLIYRTESIASILACSQGRFGGLEIMPIHSRENEPAKRLIVRGTRASRAPLSLLPGFVVHDSDGNFTEKAAQIFRGESLLEF